MTTVAMAQSPRRLNIQSKVDQFELLLNGNSGTIAGKPADLSGFKELLGMLSNPLGNECPTLKTAPDVTVKENGQTRSIYLELGLISDGKNCLNVGGEGLLYFPIHRDFLIGPKQDGIAIKSPLKVFRQGVKLFELKKAGDTWTAEETATLLDWDFIERFQNSLRSFTVRFRAQPELAKGKTKMIVQIGDQSYEFYKITNVVWALKKPGQPWLEASDDWSFWYSFDNSLLEDRYATQIRALEDPNQGKAEKLAILDKLQSKYSRNLHDLYRKFVLSADQDTQIKHIAMQRLRLKPTKETALTMAKYLQVGDDEAMKKTASQILKTHNPKGPLYKPSASATERAAVVSFWTQWAEKNQAAP
jgi:hypothetical protein